MHGMCLKSCQHLFWNVLMVTSYLNFTRKQTSSQVRNFDCLLVNLQGYNLKNLEK